jgi:two-component system, NtrC family, response regulator AtoC
MPVKKSCQSILAGEVTRAATQLIGQALRDYRGNKQKTAQVLGLSRQGLIRKLKRYWLTQKRDR